MASLSDIEALFVGRTIAAVSVRGRSDYGDAVQLSSITFEDGTEVPLSGEHDCAYIYGTTDADDNYFSAPTFEEEEEDEEEGWEPDPVEATPRPTLREGLLPLIEGTKYESYLDLKVVDIPEEWVCDRAERQWVLELGLNGLVAVGVVNSPLKGETTLTYARLGGQLTFWVPDWDTF